ncbi:YciI family protein [Nesterenkonia sp. PF2B19]|uniref:YciI family protein n=1 Tax=Nesterenkonia sp. PF2B19 TaxID=1881858 RepID=UPI000872A80C|nr:YciI family protein [Nesterenkonia sp. PF2B19]OSM43304.1 hypothetical protein BCY76_009020 [Nesterenkonia sp. PF2B19]
MKYLLIKHYRGAPAAANDVPMRDWTPEEVADHVEFMERLAERLQQTGEYVNSLALAPEGTWVSSDDQGAPVVGDELPEGKDLIAGWMLIDVADESRAREIAAELAHAPGAGGRPVREWLELRPALGAADGEG